MEVMVALTVMGFAVVYLVQLFSSNLRLIGTSQDYMTALTQAEAVMRERQDRREVLERRNGSGVSGGGIHIGDPEGKNGEFAD
jgi:hypothetical protein